MTVTDNNFCNIFPRFAAQSPEPVADVHPGAKPAKPIFFVTDRDAK